jgi:hypothetical protein
MQLTQFPALVVLVLAAVVAKVQQVEEGFAVQTEKLELAVVNVKEMAVLSRILVREGVTGYVEMEVGPS